MSHRRRFPLRFIACAAAALLAGCGTAGPDFVAPALDLPASWAGLHGGAPELAQLAPLAQDTPAPDWRALRDPVLQQLFERADAAGSDVRVAALRLAQARTQRGAAASARLPQLNASAAAARQRQSPNGSSTRILDALGGANQAALRDELASPYDSYDAGFDASWELDFWGRVKRATEAADAAVEQSREMQRQARLGVRAEVARAYLDLRAAQSEAGFLRAQLRAAEDSLRLTGERARNGLVPELDAVLQRGLVAALRVRLPALLRREAASANQLTLLCALPPGALAQSLQAGGATLIDSTPPALQAGLPSELAARRPDIRAAMAQLHAATARIGVAAADLYPRVTLNGSFGFEALATGRLADWASRQWRIGPGLSVPLFDAGRRRAVVALRELEQQEAALHFRQTVLAALHEVDDAISQYNAEQLAHADLQRQLESARSAWSLSRERYRGGMTSFMPVLDAERTLAKAQADIAQHNAKLWLGWVSLLKSLGMDGDAA